MSSMSEGIVSGIKIGGVICLIGGGLATLARMKNKVVFKGRVMRDKDANIPYRGEEVGPLTVVAYPTNKVIPTSIFNRPHGIALPAGSNMARSNNDGRWSITMPWRNSHYGVQTYLPIPYEHAEPGKVKVQTKQYQRETLPTFNFRDETDPLFALSPGNKLIQNIPITVSYESYANTVPNSND
tara:strand:+ start:49176 stop:49724 length:549 start_codon:yes stop_codon:yes gene_type:complete